MKNSYKQFYIDIIILAIFNVGVYFLCRNIDLFEVLYFFSRDHESIELDEILLVFSSLSFSIIFLLLIRFAKIKRLLKISEKISCTDPLTGLYNRRIAKEKLQNELDQFRRYHLPLSIILIDIDDFKKINDFFGHSYGDDVLIEIATIISNSSRNTDTCIRWGGEEFLIICSNTPQDLAFHIAKRILTSIRLNQMLKVNTITASLGVSSINKDQSIENLIKETDEYLYQAKHQGKNRVHSSVLSYN